MVIFKLAAWRSLNQFKSTSKMKHGILYLLFAAAALAQTPPGSHPPTRSNLGVIFENVTVTPGVWISPDGMNEPIFTFSKRC
jgi:hypothetical protein